MWANQDEGIPSSIQSYPISLTMLAHALDGVCEPVDDSVPTHEEYYRMAGKARRWDGIYR